MVETLIAQFEEYDRRIFWTLLSLTCVVVLAYLYFLSISVYAVIHRRTAEGETERLAAKISTLESQYATLDKHISLEVAHAQGFQDISVPRYISHEGSRDTLTLRTGSSIER